jgi:nucleoside triphosphate pyrophosphatase
MTNLYLASQSPRRGELLSQIGVQYQRLSVDVEECQGCGELPSEYVQRLAVDKSAAGWRELQRASLPIAPVMGADTIVVLDGQVLEKPSNEAEAVAMLARLSGRVHQVFTAVALTSTGAQEVVVCSTEVTFTRISESQARDYWQTREPKDKAGGYGIQGAGAVFVENLAGSYSGVVGLPLFETQQLLNQFDVSVWQFD